MAGKLMTWWMSFLVFMNKKHATLFSFRVPEACAACLLLCSSILTYYFAILSKLPEIFEGYHKTILGLGTLGTWIFTAVVSNFFLVRMRRSSIRNRILQKPVVQPLEKSSTIETGVEQDNSEVHLREGTKHMGEHFTRSPIGNDWHVCEACEILVPPRSWHCRVCDVCILRRDHHCIFTGCCIGEENHCNFMGLILYIAIGGSICSGFSIYYFLWLEKVNCWYFLFRSMFFMYAVFYDFDIIQVLFSIVIAGSVVSWGVFAYYMYISLKGQTSADSFKSIDRVAPGTNSYQNLKQFLGPRPILRILWPFHKALKIDYSSDASESTVDEYRKSL